MIIAINGKRRLTPEQLDATASLLDAVISSFPSPRLIAQPRYLSALRDKLPLSAQTLLSHISPAPYNLAALPPDIAISIGGDGTFLRTARWIGALQTPILGINSGHLGFLSDVSLDQAPDIIRTIAEGDITIHPRTLLKLHTDTSPLNDPRRILSHPFALNEIAILRHDTASIISVSATIDDVPLATYQADGLLISTPTGSTAYNLSVGGPIIHPLAPCWAISPIAAHTLTQRPLIIPDTTTLRLRIDSRTPTYQLSLDGNTVTLPLSATLTITRAPFITNIITRPTHTFPQTLRTKLLWGIENR